jgi:UDP-glucuronate decarboxylase
MRNVIITGAAGFLGSHLALHHLNAGDRVTGIDNFCSSSPKSRHYEKLLGYNHYAAMHVDITNPNILTILSDCDSKADLIYNFACPASPPIYQSMPIETMLTCVAGTRNMLEHARKTDAIVVHASTSEIYGDPSVSPQPESYRGCVNSYGPRSCYDEGKRAAEALCFDYFHKFGVDARLVRIFNTYGPHMHPNDGRVVSNLINQTLRGISRRGEKLTLFGDGSQTRSFCYVSDLIRAIVAMGELKDNPWTPINIGNPNEFTMTDLAFKVISKVRGIPEDSSSIGHMIEERPLPIDDPTQRCPDITLAKKILNWEPVVQLDEGLEKTIKYFRELR